MERWRRNILADRNTGVASVAWVIGVMVLGTVSCVASTQAHAELVFEPSSQELAFPGAALQALAAGDVDRDGKVDLVVADGDGDMVGVFFGNGDGTFLEPASSYELTDFAGLRALELADVNRDGNLDLVVVSEVSNVVLVMLNQGAGVFGRERDFPVGGGPVAVAVGDWNRDGALDLAVANDLDDNVTILLGDGTGNFNPTATPVPVGSGPVALTSADLDGDGILDLVATSATSGELSVGSLFLLRGLGTGQFAFAGELQGEYIDTPVASLVADFDGDGDVDIAVVNQDLDDVAVLRNAGGFAFELVGNFPVASQLNGGVLGDFDRDGHADIACTGEFEDKVGIIRGQGDGSFGAPTLFDVGPAPAAIVAADFDRDGWLDIAATSQDAETISVLLNRTGGAPPPTPTPTPTPQVPSCSGDCNGDGSVTIDELVRMVNIALGLRPVTECLAGDENGDESITIDEIIKAVNRALGGCPNR